LAPDFTYAPQDSFGSNAVFAREILDLLLSSLSNDTFPAHGRLDQQCRQREPKQHSTTTQNRKKELATKSGHQTVTMIQGEKQPQIHQRGTLSAILVLAIVVLIGLAPLGHQTTIQSSTLTEQQQLQDAKNASILPANKQRPKKQPLVDKDGTVFSHYYMHLPKTGGTYGYKMIKELVRTYQKERGLSVTPCFEGLKATDVRTRLLGR